MNKDVTSTLPVIPHPLGYKVQRVTEPWKTTRRTSVLERREAELALGKYKTLRAPDSRGRVIKNQATLFLSAIVSSVIERRGGHT